MDRWLRSVMLSGVLAAPLLAQHAGATPETFHTAARFSVDADVMRFQTAVALAEPHARYKGSFTWVRLYFYAFPLATDDVTAIANGSIGTLERRRSQAGPGEPDLNHSRAVLHFLLDKAMNLSNASLEVPGLTCTIVSDPAKAHDTVQIFKFDGGRLQVQAKGTSVCDLTSVGGGRRTMAWDAEVDIPVFAGR